MVDRVNKPTALDAGALAGKDEPVKATVDVNSDKITARLPTGESIEILTYGATVISWKDANGVDKLWLSEGAKLDGSKAVRGGIPLVFPVFGTARDHPATGKLPQHGLARTSTWEFLGMVRSEAADEAANENSTVKLDFGLSYLTADEKLRSLWDLKFHLIYSVTLSRNSLTTAMVVTNEDDRAFDFQTLMHTYLRVSDISQVHVAGLNGASYVDKVGGPPTTKSETSNEVTIGSEVDRVYTTPNGATDVVSVVENGKKLFDVARDNLNDVVVWNPWDKKAESMADFVPKDGYKQMICIEAGSVKGWQTLESGDAFEGSQTITMH